MPPSLPTRKRCPSKTRRARRWKRRATIRASATHSAGEAGDWTISRSRSTSPLKLGGVRPVAWASCLACRCAVDSAPFEIGANVEATDTPCEQLFGVRGVVSALQPPLLGDSSDEDVFGSWSVGVRTGVHPELIWFRASSLSLVTGGAR